MRLYLLIVLVCVCLGAMVLVIHNNCIPEHSKNITAQPMRVHLTEARSLNYIDTTTGNEYYQVSDGATITGDVVNWVDCSALPKWQQSACEAQVKLKKMNPNPITVDELKSGVYYSYSNSVGIDRCNLGLGCGVVWCKAFNIESQMHLQQDCPPIADGTHGKSGNECLVRPGNSFSGEFTCYNSQQPNTTRVDIGLSGCKVCEKGTPAAHWVLREKHSDGYCFEEDYISDSTTKILVQIVQLKYSVESLGVHYPEGGPFACEEKYTVWGYDGKNLGSYIDKKEAEKYAEQAAKDDN
jgi:hypothetical protein